MNFFASLISFVLGVMFWIIFNFIIVVRTAQKNNLTYLLLILSFTQIIIPFLYILVKFFKKEIKDLDITERKQRFKPLLIFLLFLIISLFIVYLHKNIVLAKIYFIMLVIIFINGTITLFWKISLHMAINIGASILINYLYNWKLPVLYLSVPLVYWSRLKLKKHTKMQLIISFLLNGGITIFLIKKLF